MKKLMRILLKPVWLVLFLVLVAANLIMSIGMKIGERAGARRKIGGKLIYNVELINQYIEREYGQ